MTTPKKPKRIRAEKKYLIDIEGEISLHDTNVMGENNEVYFIRRADVAALWDQVFNDYHDSDEENVRAPISSMKLAFRKAGMTAPKKGSHGDLECNTTGGNRMSAPVTDADHRLAKAIADEIAARLATNTRLPTWREFSDQKQHVEELKGALREIRSKLAATSFRVSSTKYALDIIERELGDEEATGP